MRYQSSQSDYRSQSSAERPNATRYQGDSRPQSSAGRPSATGYQGGSRPQPGTGPVRYASTHSYSRSRRKRRMMRRRIRALVLLVLLIGLIVLIVHLAKGCSNPDVTKQPDVGAFSQISDGAQSALALPTATPDPAAVSSQEVPGAAQQPTVEPTAEPTEEPVSSAYAANAVYRPEAEPGHLPVFKKSDTGEKIIAITVDDCYQAQNLTTIVQTAIDCGGKLTIFPIGENALREDQARTLLYAWQNGFELENHTMTHNSLYSITDERLAQEVYYQNLALNKVLGVEYTEHFLRPRGGDARNDQRMHAYARQQGYYGIAHWTFSGSDRNISMETLKNSLKPGSIYLFHTTDTDRKRLVEFIPYAVSQGYRLVTLNEMFGYPENETAPLTEPLEGRTPPALEPYTTVPETYKKTTYAYGVLLLQQKLIDLGYLNGEAEAAADGVYGATCAEAVSRFQGEHGLPVTGEADPETQAKIDEAHDALGTPGNQTVAVDAPPAGDPSAGTEAV